MPEPTLALARTSIAPESFALNFVVIEAIIEPHALKPSAAVIRPSYKKVREHIVVSSIRG